jgi:hypothetical protein
MVAPDIGEMNPQSPGGPAQIDASESEGRDRSLAPAALRALAEAQARRAEADRESAPKPKELRGRDGPEPTRYGDWEVKGIASDF